MPRAEWTIDVPARTRMVLDERSIPTGEQEPVTVAAGPLGARTFDDGYADLGAAPRFTLAGGGRTLAVEFVEGYEYAQVYAPAEHDLICLRADDGSDECTGQRRQPPDRPPRRVLHRRLPHRRGVTRTGA